MLKRMHTFLPLRLLPVLRMQRKQPTNSCGEFVLTKYCSPSSKTEGWVCLQSSLYLARMRRARPRRVIRLRATFGVAQLQRGLRATCDTSSHPTMPPGPSVARLPFAPRRPSANEESDSGLSVHSGESGELGPNPPGEWRPNGNEPVVPKE